MLILSIILIIISILLTIYSVYAIHHTHKINIEIDEQNKNILVQNDKLTNISNVLNVQIANYKDKLNDIQNNISKTLDNQKELSQKAFENYCDILEKNYQEKEEEYAQYEDSLQEAYSNIQLQLLQQKDQCQEELDKIQATRAAAIQAIAREKEIEEQLAFYCLSINELDLKDIAVLESIKSKLNNPRILSMLIWQTYWRKPMTDLCNNVIGTSAKTGIYKITNQKTKECYIGQAANIADRFKEHAKCGLGIDTPAGNKLYKSIQDYGIWNFSWEILEECPRDQLDEKERYYIQLYQSCEFGLNSNKGIGKK